MLTIGFKQTVVAFRECMRLKQTFLYLIFYFLMCVSIIPLLPPKRPVRIELTSCPGAMCSTRRCESGLCSVRPSLTHRSFDWVY